MGFSLVSRCLMPVKINCISSPFYFRHLYMTCSVQSLIASILTTISKYCLLYIAVLVSKLWARFLGNIITAAYDMHNNISYLFSFFRHFGGIHLLLFICPRQGCQRYPWLDLQSYINWPPSGSQCDGWPCIPHMAIAPAHIQICCHLLHSPRVAMLHTDCS